MKALFDSSVLVAALLETHVSHAAARASVMEHRSRPGEFVISQHALVETYAVLTGMPTRPKLTPPMVRLAMSELLSPAAIVSLSAADYDECLRLAEALNITGSATHDLLHVKAAEVCHAEQLITLNAKHFLPLARGSSIAIIEPET